MTGGLAFIDATVIACSRYDAPQQPACTEIMSWVAEGRLQATTSVLQAFDGLDGLRRVDPLDTDAVKALVGG